MAAVARGDGPLNAAAHATGAAWQSCGAGALNLPEFHVMPSWLRTGLLLLVLAAPLVPVALVPMPPLFDYHNHFARLWLLMGGVAQAPLAAMYAVDWSGAATNIGIDLIAAAFAGLLDAETLLPALLGVALVLPPLGLVMLHRAVFGGWHWWQLGFGVLAWNTTVLEGFLNFHMGLGLALLAAAADGRLRALPPAAVFAIRAVIAAVALVVHPFAAFFYAALLAALALGPQPFAGRPRRRLRAAIWAGATATLPVLLLVLFAPALPGADQAPAQRVMWTGYAPRAKADMLLSAIWTYGLKRDLVFVGLFAAPIGWAMMRRQLAVHGGLMLVVVGMVVLALITPAKVAGAWQADARFPAMALLAGVAALRPGPGALSRRAEVALASALVLLVWARAGWILTIWQERRGDVAAVERILAHVPPGAAVLPMEHRFDWNLWQPGMARPPRGRHVGPGHPATWHLATLAVVRRHAFVPTLFAARGKQPLRVLPPWNEIAQQDAEIVSASLLPDPDPDLLRRSSADYVQHWRARFDYLLLLNADLPDFMGGLRDLPELELVEDARFARLYRIGRPALATR